MILEFIAYGYQHCINGDDDWDGYEISRIIKADSPDEANQKLFLVEDFQCIQNLMK